MEELLLQAQILVHVPVETLGVHASTTASSPTAAPVAPARVARGRAGISPVPAGDAEEARTKRGLRVVGGGFSIRKE